jgi:hypothetical protein
MSSTRTLSALRPTALIAAQGIVLLTPTVLAFFTGGYFTGPRASAGCAVWLAVLLGALVGVGVPRTKSVLLTIGGLALLAAWTLLSILWAPIAGDAYQAGEITVLYLGALIAGSMVLRGRVLAWVEPLLAGGTMIVIGYGLGNRLLPGLLRYARSTGAGGRLEQPLTYWNAMGELAALGFVLCARIAGDRTRPRWLRSLAASLAAPLGMALYISYSRGAVFACLAGLIALLAIAPRREQLGGAVRAPTAAVAATIAAIPFKAVTSLSGPLSTRETHGAVVLGLLMLISLLAGLAQHAVARRERTGDLGVPRHTPLIATGLVAAGLALAIVVGAHETTGAPQLSGGASRLTTLQSNRYDYWSVALRAFASEPVRGVGAGGWSVDWLRWRHVNEYATDAHSLELQTLAELGVVGVAFLAVFVLGLVYAARRALRGGPEAVGAVAGLVVYFAHSPLDWDWQMPAVTLVAIALGGLVLSLGSERSDPRTPRARQGAISSDPA